ncbi:MAG: lytic transglycosylase domain-containing protein [Candidatus Saccharibacteria bacterium]|nr:lytic transglycosylase domain-containing protein [Pseudorhodobacter sp.]
MSRFVPLLFRFLMLSLALMLSPLSARADQASEVAALSAALKLTDQRDWDAASAAARSAGTVGADVIDWIRLRAGDGNLGAYESFLQRRPDWPGLPYLRDQGEVAVARSGDAVRVMAYFGTEPPRTGAGSLALVRAYDALGRAANAEAEALRGWLALDYTSEEQAALMLTHRDAVASGHQARLDRLLWDDRSDEAQRMLPLVSKSWVALATARLALRADKDGVTALVNAVPAASKDDAGLAYERFLFRMRRDNYADAATLILERSANAKSLGDPAKWAERRITLARYLMRTGAPKQAYRVAASHNLSGGTEYAELEFLAGYVALRKLNEPDRALNHFNHLQSTSSTPISLARAWYWTGRTEEAAGNIPKARNAYQTAATYQTGYYGLLAAEKLGLDLDPSALSNRPPVGDWTNAAFTQTSVFQAARRLYLAGNSGLSARFLLHLGEGLSTPDFELLSEYALQAGQYRSALLIAKAAIDRDVVFPRPYFAMPDMVPDGLRVSRALALSIARRESEFDPGVRSSAGALGLMQILPETAKRMAAELDLPFSQNRLTTDPAYNVTLGAEYLRKMLDEFGPSIALIASGYNAGPGRPRAWIDAFGDPRLPSVDVVDWIESIPFAETRTYVMRVAEGVVIYRAKLKGVAGPVRIIEELTGR